MRPLTLKNTSGKLDQVVYKMLSIFPLEPGVCGLTHRASSCVKLYAPREKGCVCGPFGTFRTYWV